MVSVPVLLYPNPHERGGARALPAALLPYAAAQLLPLLFLPPERVRTLDAAQVRRVHDRAGGVSIFLLGRMVRSPPADHPREPRALCAVLPCDAGLSAAA